jgi:hypothetical protein
VARRRRKATPIERTPTDALDLPASIAGRFQELRVDATVEELAAVRPFVESRVADLQTTAAMFSDVDGALAAQIGKTLCQLIDHADRLDERARSLVRAAVTYFALHDAELFDVIPTGLADQARMVDAVCAAVGRRDLMTS